MVFLKFYLEASAEIMTISSLVDKQILKMAYMQEEKYFILG